MIRNLKMLGLAIVAVLALGAMGATAASAAEFHSEASSSEVSGEQSAKSNDEWTFEGGTVECLSATYSGSISGATAATASVTPAYSECTGNTSLNWTIDMNGCYYDWHAATVDLICPAGKVVEFTSPGCVVTVPPQKGMNGVSFDNQGSGANRDTLATANANNVVYEEHNKGFLPTCLEPTQLLINGTYSTSETLKANAGGKQVGLWVE